MATPYETTWPIEPHTAAKHKILKNYLSAWFPIMNRYNRRLVYLDGFSGPGIYKGGEPGSPIIALKVASQHFRPIEGEAVFLFVEERQDRAKNLESEIAKIQLPKNYKCHVEFNEFEPTVTKILNELDQEGKGLAPTFAFVDPFGFSGLTFALMERLLKHDGSEAFITFMVDSINRFLTSPDDKIKAHIRNLFGTDEVFDVVDGKGDRVNALTQLYQRQLMKLGRFVRSFEMRDKHGKTIYYLQFVSKHSMGHLKMKEAMWQVDSEGEFCFSDATNPTQQILFQVDHDEPLFNIIKKRYAGRTIPVSDIRSFVQDETGYIDKHMISSLRFGERTGRINVKDVRSDGEKRRKNSFPNEVIVTIIA